MKIDRKHQILYIYKNQIGSLKELPSDSQSFSLGFLNNSHHQGGMEHCLG
jgi:hypothetical protein